MDVSAIDWLTAAAVAAGTAALTRWSWDRYVQPRLDAAAAGRERRTDAVGRARSSVVARAVGGAQIPSRFSRVAVIITGHNYGRFLEEAIESVLAQTHPAAEVVVVDDSSTDETARVAAHYAPRGVRYVRTEAGNPHEARGVGLQHTRSPVVLFLDADNALPPRYLECGLPLFADDRVGVVYADLEYFGTPTGDGRKPGDRTTFPPFSRELLAVGNFVDTCALIRRDVLEATGVFEDPLPIDFRRTPEDHWMFLQIADAGWDFRKQTQAVRYRLHPGQLGQQIARTRTEADYWITTGLRHRDVTLVLPLAGRRALWPAMAAFLQRQTWPHRQIRLLLIDTSRDDAFHATVRQWVARSDYPDVHLLRMRVGRPGLADAWRYHRPTEHAVQLAMCRIWNRARQIVDTDYCWSLEDDVIPPADVLERLARNFRPKVGVVCAPYPSRFDPNPVVYVWDRTQPFGVRRLQRPPADAPQVTPIDGSGFGCLLIRTHLLKRHPFSVPPGEAWYDTHFFRRLDPAWKRVCDWTCWCDHLSPRHFDPDTGLPLASPSAPSPAPPDKQ